MTPRLLLLAWLFLWTDPAGQVHMSPTFPTQRECESMRRYVWDVAQYEVAHTAGAALPALRPCVSTRPTTVGG